MAVQDRIILETRLNEGKDNVSMKVQYRKENKVLTSRWCTTNDLNPLAVSRDSPTQEPLYKWSSPEVWISFWDQSMSLTRPFKNKPEKTGDEEDTNPPAVGGKRRRANNAYKVEKVLKFRAVDCKIKVAWVGYSKPTFEPVSSLVAGPDFYYWSCQTEWVSFCEHMKNHPGLGSYFDLTQTQDTASPAGQSPRTQPAKKRKKTSHASRVAPYTAPNPDHGGSSQSSQEESTLARRLSVPDAETARRLPMLNEPEPEVEDTYQAAQPDQLAEPDYNAALALVAAAAAAATAEAGTSEPSHPGATSTEHLPAELAPGIAELHAQIQAAAVPYATAPPDSTATAQPVPAVLPSTMPMIDLPDQLPPLPASYMELLFDPAAAGGSVTEQDQQGPGASATAPGVESSLAASTAPRLQATPAESTLASLPAPRAEGPAPLSTTAEVTPASPAPGPQPPEVPSSSPAPPTADGGGSLPRTATPSDAAAALPISIAPPHQPDPAATEQAAPAAATPADNPAVERVMGEPYRPPEPDMLQPPPQSEPASTAAAVPAAPAAPVSGGKGKSRSSSGKGGNSKASKAKAGQPKPSKPSGQGSQSNKPRSQSGQFAKSSGQGEASKPAGKGCAAQSTMQRERRAAAVAGVAKAAAAVNANTLAHGRKSNVQQQADGHAPSPSPLAESPGCLSVPEQLAVGQLLMLSHSENWTRPAAWPLAGGCTDTQLPGPDSSSKVVEEQLLQLQQQERELQLRASDMARQQLQLQTAAVILQDCIQHITHLSEAHAAEASESTNQQTALEQEHQELVDSVVGLLQLLQPPQSPPLSAPFVAQPTNGTAQPMAVGEHVQGQGQSACEVGGQEGCALSVAAGADVPAARPSLSSHQAEAGQQQLGSSMTAPINFQGCSLDAPMVCGGPGTAAGQERVHSCTGPGGVACMEALPHAQVQAAVGPSGVSGQQAGQVNEQLQQQQPTQQQQLPAAVPLSHMDGTLQSNSSLGAAPPQSGGMADMDLQDLLRLVPDATFQHPHQQPLQQQAQLGQQAEGQVMFAPIAAAQGSPSPMALPHSATAAARGASASALPEPMSVDTGVVPVGVAGASGAQWDQPVPGMSCGMACTSSSGCMDEPLPGPAPMPGADPALSSGWGWGDAQLAIVMARTAAEALLVLLAKQGMRKAQAGALLQQMQARVSGDLQLLMQECSSRGLQSICSQLGSAALQIERGSPAPSPGQEAGPSGCEPSQHRHHAEGCAGLPFAVGNSGAEQVQTQDEMLQPPYHLATSAATTRLRELQAEVEELRQRCRAQQEDISSMSLQLTSAVRDNHVVRELCMQQHGIIMQRLPRCRGVASSAEDADEPGIPGIDEPAPNAGVSTGQPQVTPLEQAGPTAGPATPSAPAPATSTAALLPRLPLPPPLPLPLFPTMHGESGSSGSQHHVGLPSALQATGAPLAVAPCGAPSDAMDIGELPSEVGALQAMVRLLQQQLWSTKQQHKKDVRDMLHVVQRMAVTAAAPDLP